MAMATAITTFVSCPNESGVLPTCGSWCASAAGGERCYHPDPSQCTGTFCCLRCETYLKYLQPAVPKCACADYKAGLCFASSCVPCSQSCFPHNASGLPLGRGILCTNSSSSCEPCCQAKHSSRYCQLECPCDGDGADCAPPSPPPSSGYIFPDRFSARVSGYVRDVLTDYHGRSAGWMYTDYSLGRQRVDEIWDRTSLAGTPLYAMGYRADTHLLDTLSQLLIYTDVNTGLTICNRSVGGLAAQDLFAKPSSVRQTTFEGEAVLELIKATGPLTSILYLSGSSGEPHSGTPRALLVPPTKLPGVPGNFSTLVRYEDFSQRTEPFDESLHLFDNPAACSNARGADGAAAS